MTSVAHLVRPPEPSHIALDRGGVGEEGRPITAEKRLADMDRDSVEASVMFPPIFAMRLAIRTCAIP